MERDIAQIALSYGTDNIVDSKTMFEAIVSYRGGLKRHNYEQILHARKQRPYNYQLSIVT